MDKNESTILSGLFSPKTITASGGIVLAIMMSYFLYKITSNHLDHITKAIENQTEVFERVTSETNASMSENAKAIQGNTEVLRILERRLK